MVPRSFGSLTLSKKGEKASKRPCNNFTSYNVLIDLCVYIVNYIVSWSNTLINQKPNHYLAIKFR
jgi:hypothetical protein